MVALAMLPKDEGFCQIKRKMEMLESHNDYLLKVVTWSTCKHGGVFQPPAVGPSLDASFVGLDLSISSVGPGHKASSAMVEIPSKQNPRFLRLPRIFFYVGLIVFLYLYLVQDMAIAILDSLNLYYSLLIRPINTFHSWFPHWGRYFLFLILKDCHGISGLRTCRSFSLLTKNIYISI
jgi:hypothetical protein